MRVRGFSRWTIIVTMVLLLPVTTLVVHGRGPEAPGRLPATDPYEPNNSPAQAYVIGTGHYHGELIGLPGTDPDWFRVNVPCAGTLRAAVVVTNWVPWYGGIELTLFAADGVTELASDIDTYSTHWVTTTVTEGPYYIRVWMYACTYWLMVEVPAPPIPPTPTPVPCARVHYPERDTYISQWDPGADFDTAPRLSVRQGDVMASLLRFDVSEPGPSAASPNVQVDGAYLSLYVDSRTNTGGMDGLVYEVRRDWVSDEATWEKASDTVNWSTEGCNGEGSDRSAVPDDVVHLDARNAWFTFDVTNMVRRWVGDPAMNHGLIIKGAGTVSVKYEFASSEYGDGNMVPRLVVVSGPSRCRAYLPVVRHR